MSDKPWIGELGAGGRAWELFQARAAISETAEAIADAEHRAAARAREAAAKECDAFAARMHVLGTVADADAVAEHMAAAIRAMP